MRNVSDFYYKGIRSTIELIPLQQHGEHMYLDEYYEPAYMYVQDPSECWEIYTGVQDEVRRCYAKRI